MLSYMPGIKVPKGWKNEGKRIARTYKFKTYMEAIGFLNIVATIGEELMHHPDIYLENHNELTIKTTTHEKGRVTAKDFELISRIEMIPRK